MLPTRCLVCRDWSAGPFCGPCRDRYAPGLAVHPRCGLCGLRVPAGVRVCSGCCREAPPQDATIVAADYAHPWDALVVQLKFSGRCEMAAALAAVLASAVAQVHPHGQDTGCGPIDLVVPVPLSRQGLQRRGFNQAWEIARRVAARLRVPARADILLRWVDLAQQSQAQQAQRLQRLRGVFGVAAGQRHRVVGRSVAVVDDVYTTGATAAEAVRALRAAGARGVQIWAFARTPAAEDGAS